MSLKYRPSVGQVSVKYRSCIDQLSVKCRSCVGQVTVVYRSSIGQVSVEYRRSNTVSVDMTIGRLSGAISVDCRPTLDRWSADCRPTSARESVDIAADISTEATYSTHDPEILRVVVLPLVDCCASFYVPNAGLLIPNGGRRRPQGDENSLEIPWIFDVEKPSFLEIPRLVHNLTSQQLVKFLFTRR